MKIPFFNRKSVEVAESASTPPESNYSATQLANLLLEAVPELSETMSPADMVLALDDRGWITRWSQSGTRTQLSPTQRKTLIEDSRTYWTHDPLGKQPVRLWSDYAIGTGITYKDEDAKAEPGKTAPPSDNQKKLDRFWKYHKNRCLTSSQGQWELSNQLLIDGDLFFAVVTGGEVPVLRTIDALQISDIISDPEDDRTILCYKRTFNGPNGSERNLYYKDWSAEDSDLDGLIDPDTKKAITVEDNVVVYHHAFEKLGKRGYGLLFCVLDWSRYHRAFMSARVSLTAALAKFAHKLTVKGSDKVVNAVASRLGSTVPANGLNGLPERNPPTTAGGTFTQNQGLDLQPMPRATGGGDAKTDGDQLKLMVCCGTNVHQHYLGDPSTGNLATAEAMELPMLKSFTRYQESWKDCWRDIFSIVLEEGLDEENPAAVKVHMPPMLKDDLNKMGTFLMGLHQVFPEIQVPEILEMCLVALGAPNIDETMASIQAKAQELAAQQAANQIAQGNGATGDGKSSLAASGSPLGPQLPQPSIKVSKFTTGPASKPSAVKESDIPWLEVINNNEGLAEAVKDFSGSVRLLVSAIESRQSQLEAESSSRRHLDVSALIHKEDESVKAINRLAEAISKDAQPLLSESSIGKLLEHPKPTKISKRGKISRGANGEMQFEVEEAPVES